jgi:hypothetical protein
MIIWNSQDLVLAVIGSVGILTTGVVALYGFRRNRNGCGRYQ